MVQVDDAASDGGDADDANDVDHASVDGDANGVAALTVNSGNDATSGCSGIIHLNGFTDATNFKYFVGHTCFLEANNQYTGWFAAAYNTTTAFNHINIIFASGNIRSGFIHLYGLGEQYGNKNSRWCENNINGYRSNCKRSRRKNMV